MKGGRRRDGKYSFVVHINLQDLITEIKVQAVPYKRSEKSQLTMEFFVLFFTGSFLLVTLNK